MTITADPLCWPTGWKRTVPGYRKVGPFGLAGDITSTNAAKRLRDELRRFGVRDDDIIISSNLMLRLDGLPYSKQRDPKDPGVAVYWKESGTRAERCMAIDIYTKVEQNIAALARTIDAMRAIERHGGAAIIERAFTGFTALPAPIISGMARPWYEVLEVNALAGEFEVRSAYLRLRSKRHPDHGGTAEAFNELQRAHEEAMREFIHGH